MRSTTIRQLQATLRHLLEHEGATPDTQVVLFLDAQVPVAETEPGPDNGVFVPVQLGDYLGCKALDGTLCAVLSRVVR